MISGTCNAIRVYVITEKICDIFCENGDYCKLSPALLKAEETISQGCRTKIQKGIYLSDGFQKIVVCENCLYYDSISEFYNAHRYCLECLCDHACCPICKIGYHPANISE